MLLQSNHKILFSNHQVRRNWRQDPYLRHLSKAESYKGGGYKIVWKVWIWFIVFRNFRNILNAELISFPFPRSPPRPAASASLSSATTPSENCCTRSTTTRTIWSAAGSSCRIPCLNYPARPTKRTKLEPASPSSAPPPPPRWLSKRASCSCSRKEGGRRCWSGSTPRFLLSSLWFRLYFSRSMFCNVSIPESRTVCSCCGSSEIDKCLRQSSIGI